MPRSPSSVLRELGPLRAGEFFTGSLSTVRQAGEIITELHLPFWPRYRRWAFEEFGSHDAVPIGKFLAP
jgi:hypothetical protein